MGSVAIHVDDECNGSYSETGDTTNLLITLQLKQHMKTFHGESSFYGAEITHKTPQKKREEILRKFEDRKHRFAVIASVHVLDEGIDLVSCDGVFIANPSRGKEVTEATCVRTVQRICRAVRKDANNPEKTANVFVYLEDKDEDVELACHIMDMMRRIDPGFAKKMGMMSRSYEAGASYDVKLEEVNVAMERWRLVDDAKVMVESLEERSVRRAREYVEWGETNGRRPSIYSKDKDEKRHGNWFYGMQSAARGTTVIRYVLYDEVRRILSEALGEDWHLKKDKEALAVERAKEYVEWVKTNGRRPSHHSKDKDEKIHGNWFQYMQKAARGTTGIRNVLYDEVKRILSEALGADWHLKKDKEELAVEKAKEYVEWVETNGRRPSVYSKDKDEKTHGNWFQDMQKAARGTGGRNGNVLYDEVRIILSEAFGEDRHLKKDQEALAVERAKEYVEWVKTNGRRPSHHSKDKDEKTHGKWFQNMQSAARGTRGRNGNVLYDEVRIILSEAFGEDWWRLKKRASSTT